MEKENSEIKKKTKLSILTPILERLEGDTDTGQFQLSDEKDLVVSKKTALCMCQLPGRAKDPKTNKKLKFQTDFQKLKDSGITDILCLLNRYELRSAGVELENY